jgi:hypothetical protein
VRPQHVHNLSHNKAERSPRHIITFDTETRWHTTPAGEVHTLRLWCLEDLWRGVPNRSRVPLASARGLTSAELADQIHARAKSSETTWVFAHNLGFDLAVTALPLLLLARGWVITQSALTIDHPWLRMRNKSRRLTMADSHSWLPKKLEVLGDDLGLHKPSLPDNDDSEVAWYERCAADVRILSAALLQLMDWWDDGGFGNWSLTGPATGWNAYRHRPSPETVTIDPDPDIRAWERAAILGGRHEVWRVGNVDAPRILELDFERSHLTVCRDLYLPRKRTRTFDHLELDDPILRNERWQVMADCVVRTEVPRYPLVVKRRTWFPVGTFRTRLCAPEIRTALNRGELVEIGAGHVYRMGHQMHEWACWLETLLDGSDQSTPPMAARAAKSWSRTVPGKWATRTTREVDCIDSHLDGWWLEPMTHHPGGVRGSLLYLGGRQHQLLHDQEAEDSFPAVLAWIQSYVRDRLGRLIDQFTLDELISCNTDGVVIRPRGYVDLAKLGADTWPLKPRVKGMYRRLEVISPQHLIIDGKPRLAGVAYNADRTGPSTWAWQTWPGLGRQIEMRSAAGYVRENRKVDLSRVPVARWVLEDGTTVPPRSIESPAGTWGLSNWLPVSDGAVYGPLRAAQHPVLARLSGHGRRADADLAADRVISAAELLPA